MGKDRSRRWITILAYLALFHILLAYGLPPGVFLLLALGMGVLYARVGAIGAVAVSLTLLGLTLPLIGHATWHAYRATIDAAAWPRNEHLET